MVWQENHQKERSDYAKMLLMSELVADGYSKLSPELSYNQMSHYRAYHIHHPDNQENCHIYDNDKEIICVINGTATEATTHWKRNEDTGHSLYWRPLTPKLTPSPQNEGAEIHPGFAKALFGDDYEKEQTVNPESFGQKISDKLTELYRENPRPISFAGHSAGGAMSVILADYMTRAHPNIEVGDIVTLGSPRFANQIFFDGLDEKLPERYLRCELMNDPATPWPPQNLYMPGGYVHGGTQYVLELDGTARRNCKNAGHPYDTYSKKTAGIMLLYTNPVKLSGKLLKATSLVGLKAANLINFLSDPHRALNYVRALQIQTYGQSHLPLQSEANDIEKIGVDQIAEAIHEMIEKGFQPLRTKLNKRGNHEFEDSFNRMDKAMEDYGRVESSVWISQVTEILNEAVSRFSGKENLDHHPFIEFRDLMLLVCSYDNYARSKTVEEISKSKWTERIKLPSLPRFRGRGGAEESGGPEVG